VDALGGPWVASGWPASSPEASVPGGMGGVLLVRLLARHRGALGGGVGLGEGRAPLGAGGQVGRGPGGGGFAAGEAVVGAGLVAGWLEGEDAVHLLPPSCACDGVPPGAAGVRRLPPPSGGCDGAAGAGGGFGCASRCGSVAERGCPGGRRAKRIK